MNEKNKATVVLSFFFIPLVVIPPFHDAWLAPKDILFLVLAGFLAIHLLLNRSESPMKEIPYWCVWSGGFFVGAPLLGTCFARYPGTALAMAGIYIAWIVWIITLIPLMRKPPIRQLMGDLIIYQALIQVVIGFFQVLSALPVLDKMRFTGTLGNPDFVATWIGCAFLICLLRENPFHRKNLLILIILGVGLLLSFSRGVFLSVGVALLLLGSNHQRKRAWIFLSFLIVTAAVVAVVFNPHSLYGRVHVWACTLKMILQSHGLGIGLDNFQFHYFEVQKSLFETGQWDRFSSHASMVVRAHNEYFDFLAEGGIFFLLAWVLFQSVLFREIWRHRFDKESRPFAAAFVCISVQSFFSFPFHITASLLLSAVLVADILSRSSPERTARFSMSKIRWSGFLIAVFLWLIALRALAKESFFALAKTSFNHGKSMRAQKYASEALVLFPRNPDFVCYLSQLLYRDLKFPEALTWLQQLHGTGESLDAWKLEGQILFDLHRWDEALVVYQMLEETFSQHVTPKYQLGQIYEQLGRTDEAMRMYKAATLVKAVSVKAKKEQADAQLRLESSSILKP